jgi:hypothetical protein
VFWQNRRTGASISSADFVHRYGLEFSLCRGSDDGSIVTLEATGEIPGRGDVAGGEEHAGDGELIYCIGVGARRIEHGNPALRIRLDRDIVHPAPRSLHREHVCGTSRRLKERRRMASGLVH